MEEGAVGDRAGEVGRIAAACRIIGLHRMNAAVVIEAHIVIDEEVVTLSGCGHVLVAVGPELDGALQFLGGDGGECGKLVALRFLAAETAAHPPHLHGDRIGGNAQDMADHVLHFARMLGGRPDGDVVVLAGNGHGDMAFEVEMFLPADPHPAGEAARRKLQFGLSIAPRQGQRLGDNFGAVFQSVEDIRVMRQVAIGDLRLAGGAPRDVAGFGDDGKCRLAMKLHQTVCQHRFVVEMAGADIVGMRHVLSRQHVDDAGRGFDVRQVHGDDLRMSAVGHAQRRVQRPRRFRDVVDIISGARHMLVGAVMAQGRMHGSGNWSCVPRRWNCPSAGSFASVSPPQRGEGGPKGRMRGSHANRSLPQDPVIASFHSALLPAGEKRKAAACAHAVTSKRTSSAFCPDVSSKNRNSKFFAVKIRYPAVARQSVSGW